MNDVTHSDNFLLANKFATTHGLLVEFPHYGAFNAYIYLEPTKTLYLRVNSDDIAIMCKFHNGRGYDGIPIGPEQGFPWYITTMDHALAAMSRSTELIEGARTQWANSHACYEKSDKGDENKVISEATNSVASPALETATTEVSAVATVVEASPAEVSESEILSVATVVENAV